MGSLDDGSGFYIRSLQPWPISRRVGRYRLRVDYHPVRVGREPGVLPLNKRSQSGVPAFT